MFTDQNKQQARTIHNHMTEVSTLRNGSSCSTATRDTNTSRSRLLSSEAQRELTYVSIKDFEEHVLRHRNLETKVNELASRVQYVNPSTVQHTWEELLKLRGFIRQRFKLPNCGTWSTYADNNNTILKCNTNKQRSLAGSQERYKSRATNALFRWDSDDEDESPPCTARHDNSQTNNFINPPHISVGNSHDNQTDNINNATHQSSHGEATSETSGKSNQEDEEDVLSPITVVGDEDMWNTSSEAIRDNQIHFSLPNNSYSGSLPPPPPPPISSTDSSVGLSEADITKLIEDKLNKAVESLMKQISNNESDIAALQRSLIEEMNSKKLVDTCTTIDGDERVTSTLDRKSQTHIPVIHLVKDDHLMEMSFLRESISSLEQQLSDIREYSDARDNNFSDEIQSERYRINKEISVIEEKLDNVSEVAAIAKKEAAKGMMELSNLQILQQEHEKNCANSQIGEHKDPNREMDAIQSQQQKLSNLLMNQHEELEVLKMKVEGILSPVTTMDTTQSCPSPSRTHPHSSSHPPKSEILAVVPSHHITHEPIMMILQEFEARASIERDEMRIRIVYQDNALYKCIIGLRELVEYMLHLEDSVQGKGRERMRYDPVSPPWLFLESDNLIRHRPYHHGHTTTPVRYHQKSNTISSSGLLRGTEIDTDNSNSINNSIMKESRDSDTTIVHFKSPRRLRNLTEEIKSQENSNYIAIQQAEEVVEMICDNSAIIGRIAECIVDSKQFDSALLGKVNDASVVPINTSPGKPSIRQYGSVSSKGHLPMWYMTILDIVSNESERALSLAADSIKQLCSKGNVEMLVREVACGVVEKEVGRYGRDIIKSTADERMEMIKNTGFRMMGEVEATVRMGKNEIETHIKQYISKIVNDNNNKSSYMKEDAVNLATTASMRRCEEKLKESLAVCEKSHTSEDKKAILQLCGRLMKNVFNEEIVANQKRLSESDSHEDAGDAYGVISEQLPSSNTTRGCISAHGQSNVTNTVYDSHIKEGVPPTSSQGLYHNLLPSMPRVFSSSASLLLPSTVNDFVFLCPINSSELELFSRDGPKWIHHMINECSLVMNGNGENKDENNKSYIDDRNALSQFAKELDKAKIRNAIEVVDAALVLIIECGGVQAMLPSSQKSETKTMDGKSMSRDSERHVLKGMLSTPFESFIMSPEGHQCGGRSTVDGRDKTDRNNECKNKAPHLNSDTMKDLFLSDNEDDEEEHHVEDNDENKDGFDNIHCKRLLTNLRPEQHALKQYISYTSMQQHLIALKEASAFIHRNNRTSDTGDNNDRSNHGNRTAQSTAYLIHPVLTACRLFNHFYPISLALSAAVTIPSHPRDSFVPLPDGPLSSEGVNNTLPSNMSHELLSSTSFPHSLNSPNNPSHFAKSQVSTNESYRTSTITLTPTISVNDTESLPLNPPPKRHVTVTTLNELAYPSPQDGILTSNVTKEVYVKEVSPTSVHSSHRVAAYTSRPQSSSARDIDSSHHNGIVEVSADHPSGRRYSTPPSTTRSGTQTGLNNTSEKNGHVKDGMNAKYYDTVNPSDSNSSNSECCASGLKGNSDSLYYPHLCTVVPLADIDNPQALSEEQKRKYEEYSATKREGGVRNKYKYTSRSIEEAECGVATYPMVYHAHVKGVEKSGEDSRGASADTNNIYNKLTSPGKQRHYTVTDSVLGTSPKHSQESTSYSKFHLRGSPLPPPPPPSYFSGKKSDRNDIKSLWTDNHHHNSGTQSSSEETNPLSRTCTPATVNATPDRRAAAARDFRSPSYRDYEYDDNTSVINGDRRRVISVRKSHSRTSDNARGVNMDDLDNNIAEVLVPQDGRIDANINVNIGSASPLLHRPEVLSTLPTNARTITVYHNHKHTNDINGGDQEVDGAVSCGQNAGENRTFKEKEKEKERNSNHHNTDVLYSNINTNKSNRTSNTSWNNKRNGSQPMPHRNNTNTNNTNGLLPSSDEEDTRHVLYDGDIVRDRDPTHTNIPSGTDVHGMYAFNSERNQIVIEEHFRKKQRAMQQRAARNALSILRDERRYRKV